ncbi:MAG: GNAT family N-acetyltransferase [Gammaproteobacteria bacterium]|nr:GNAT family N-acetyltransferase [Gammaproteobacteria bacterium]
MNGTSKIVWTWRSFEQLSNCQLYDLLKVRQDVFIVEQHCIYPDIDGLDVNCLHLVGYDSEQLIAYLRLIPADFHCSGNIALGRIVSLASKRGLGIGKMMMQQVMTYITKHFPHQSIQLSAQFHLLTFYQNMGFNSISEPYDEDGIKHIDMLFTPADD